MPTFEIMGPDGRKHLVQADSQPKALAQFHSLTQAAPQQSSGNWQDGPLVEAPRQPDGSVDIFAGSQPQRQQPDRMRMLETALINADQAGDTDAARTLAAEIKKQRSEPGPRFNGVPVESRPRFAGQPVTPDLDKVKRNVAKMAGMNAPVEDIDGYIASEGLTVDDVRSHQATGPLTKFQGQTVTDEMRQGARQEQLRRGAMAELERRKQVAGHPSFEEGQKMLEQEGAGPWSKYQQTEQAPWTKYQNQQPSVSFDDLVPKSSVSFDDLVLRNPQAGNKLQQFRAQYPEYDDMSDQQLSDALYRKHYSDMPRAEFDAKIGAGQPSGDQRHITIEGQRVKVGANFFQLPSDQQDATVDEIAAQIGKGKGRVSQQERMEGASGTVGAALTGFADGVPVVGPALLGTGQRGAAILSTILNGGTYDENLTAAQGITQQAQDAHPYVTTGANVAGAVAGTVPMIAAAPAAFGAGSGGIVGRTLASSASGLALGTADAGVRSGGDFEKMAIGGGYGLASGMVGPAAGKLIGLGAQKISNALANRSAAAVAGTTPRTVRGLADLAARDGLDANGIRSALDDLGPDATLMDIGPGLQGRAGGIAATPGRGQAIIRDALAERQAGANARVGQAVDDNLGPNVVPSQIEAGIKANQRALGTLYDEAFQGARAVDTRPIAEGLEAQAVNLRGDAQAAVQRVRSMLDIHGAPGNLDPNPGTLFQTRQAIDGMMAAESNPQVVRALTNARSQIDDELARSVPNLKSVDASYAELARQREALQRGQTVLDSKRTSPRPSELADEVTEGVQPQGMQIGPSAAPFRMSQGARAEVDRILGNNANDLTALNRLIKTEGDWNRSRLATLFGQDKADKLFKVLDAERVYADTANTVTRNSETARRALAAGEGKNVEPDLIRQAAAYGGITAVPRAMAIKAGDKILAALLSGRTEGLELGMSKALSSKDRAIIEALRVRERLPTSDPRVEAITRALMTGTGLLPAR